MVIYKKLWPYGKKNYGTMEKTIVPRTMELLFTNEKIMVDY